MSVFVRDEPQQYGQERREGAHLNSKGGAAGGGGMGQFACSAIPGTSGSGDGDDIRLLRSSFIISFLPSERSRILLLVFSNSKEKVKPIRIV